MVSIQLDAYYRRLGEGHFETSPSATGPWSDTLQHGSPPTALMVRLLEQTYPRPDLRVARVAVEFLGAVPFGPVAVRTVLVRPGKRIELLEAILSVGERDVLTCRVWRLSTQGETPPSAPDMPPERPGPQPQRYFSGPQALGYGNTIDWRFVRGSFVEPGSAQVWTRVQQSLIEGEPLVPIDRALLVADSANGISAVLSFQEWRFVPVSISLVFHRHPVGEWVYMEADMTVGATGLGYTASRFGDQEGMFGVGHQSLYIDHR